MKDGELLQFDSPEEILKNPANSFVEYFIGKDRLWKTPELFLVEDIMVEQLLSLTKKDNLLDALTMVEECQNKVVPVLTEGNILVGMVTPTSLLNVIYKIKPEGGEENVY